MKKLNVGIIGLALRAAFGWFEFTFVGSISICDFDKEKVIKIKEVSSKKIFENSMSMIDDNKLILFLIKSFDNNILVK